MKKKVVFILVVMLVATVSVFAEPRSVRQARLERELAVQRRELQQKQTELRKKEAAKAAAKSQQEKNQIEQEIVQITRECDYYLSIIDNLGNEIYMCIIEGDN